MAATPAQSEAAPRRKPRKERPPAKIRPPLMPLIDVMFTLLMFFLVAARIRTSEGLIPSNLPDLAVLPSGSTNVLSAIKITLNADNNGIGVRISVEGTKDDFGGSMDKLSKYLAGVKRDLGPDAPVFISPQGNVRWEHVVNAFNQAVKASFKTVALAKSG